MLLLDVIVVIILVKLILKMILPTEIIDYQGNFHV